MSGDATVRLEGRGLRFCPGGTQVLRGVDVTLHGGERVALTGPSGSGKTTLMSLLAGLARPDAGTVTLDGLPLDQVPDLRSQVGVVFQGYALVALLTAAENVELAMLAAGVPPPTAAADAAAALAAVGLADRAEHLVEELSGGQQQRVALARALAVRPRVLLADEPTAEQDPAHRRLALAAVLAAADHGAAVLLATHDEAVAERCERRLHVIDGLLVDPDDVSDPAVLA